MNSAVRVVHAIPRAPRVPLQLVSCAEKLSGDVHSSAITARSLYFGGFSRR